ncbi:hypothetical protein CPS_0646 [Colwellia psychrerythraea 34H]|uniref:Uncharacterized protein n=1 Tax=Colwellia psychrerythraea (strain 34H / ATCC BAA-681) TaxID=167879 RepID=Q488W8_COLP3|nr:hypothetical protein CPS_0646 [Colwellia psychrerythraea 34H]
MGECVHYYLPLVSLRFFINANLIKIKPEEQLLLLY